jgi:hypothetical protein
MVETVFKTIKSELIWRTTYASRWQATNAIGLYIEGFYKALFGNIVDVTLRLQRWGSFS